MNQNSEAAGLELIWSELKSCAALYWRTKIIYVIPTTRQVFLKTKAKFPAVGKSSVITAHRTER